MTELKDAVELGLEDSWSTPSPTPSQIVADRITFSISDNTFRTVTGMCQEISIYTRNSRTGYSAPFGADHQFFLTGSPYLNFYSDRWCGQPTSWITATKGSYAKIFYFQSSADGSFPLIVSHPAIPSISISVITEFHRLSFTFGTIRVNSCTPMTITAMDYQGNQRPTVSGNSFGLSPTTGTLHNSSSCSTTSQITRSTIPVGSSTVTVWYKSGPYTFSSVSIFYWPTIASSNKTSFPIVK